MYVIPFSTRDYKVDDSVIPGNQTSDTPVIFSIVPVEGQDRPRLTMLAGLPVLMKKSGQWSEAEMTAATLALSEGPKLFARAVTKVQGFYVTGEHARRAGLIAKETPDAALPETYPILTGAAFAEVAALVPFLCFDVAIEIAKLQQLAEPDRRFTSPRSGSGGPGIAAPTPTTARPARSRSKSGGTAASATPADSTGNGSSRSKS